MNQNPGIIGKKIGMTQIFDSKGEVVRCTVVQGGCVVIGKRTIEKDGYSALVLGLGERSEKRTTEPSQEALRAAHLADNDGADDKGADTDDLDHVERDGFFQAEAALEGFFFVAGGGWGRVSAQIHRFGENNK